MASYLNGETINTDAVKFSVNSSNIVSIIEKIIRSFDSEVKLTSFGIVGITIAIHGIVSDNKVLYTPYYDIDTVDLAKELEEKLKIRIYIENEANLATLAEATFDSSHENFITCSIHTGVGAGVIIDQKLYFGNEGRSGEIGHIPLYPNGLSCPCGNKGCLEQYCSQNALLYFYREITQIPSLSLDDLATDFYDGQEHAIKIIQEYSKNLSIGLISLIGSYGPEIIYINSQITRKIPVIIEWTQESLSKTLYKGVPIKQARNAENASLFGGCITSIQFFFNIDKILIDFSKN